MTELKTDDELAEEIKQWWKENGRSVIVGIALGLSAIAGWRSWNNHQEQQALQASDQYQAVLTAIKKDDQGQIAPLLSDIQKQFPKSPYSSFASMEMAKALVVKGETAAAQKQLKWALAHISVPQTKTLIQIRLAKLLINDKKLDEAMQLIKDISLESGEVLMIKGDIALLKGDPAAARAQYMSAKEKGVADQNFLQMKIDDLTPAS